MSNTSINVDQIRQYFLGLQERITAGMSELDGKTFATDSWTKPADAKLKGDGRSMILEEGNILERGGVGFSHVRGDSLPAEPLKPWAYHWYSIHAIHTFQPFT
jgi:coproporphyrinogen III oxidase